MHSSKTSAYYSRGKDNSGHPDSRTELAHHEVGRKVEDDVGNIKEGKCRGNVLGAQAENRFEVMLLVAVHRLRNANVGPDCRTKEVQDPKRCASRLVMGKQQ